MYLYKLKLRNGHEFDDIQDLAEFIKKAENHFNQKVVYAEYIGMTRVIN